MNQFETDDQNGRQKFKKDFQKFYHIEDTQEFDHTDMLMTAYTTNKVYNVELKKRCYPIQELSGSTILEKTKLQAFREALRRDKDRQIIYFNYYLNGDWIAFDLTGRIKYNEGLQKTGIRELPCTSSIDTGSRDKEVVYLYYVNNMYVQDRIHINNNNNKS